MPPKPIPPRIAIVISDLDREIDALRSERTRILEPYTDPPPEVAPPRALFTVVNNSASRVRSSRGHKERLRADGKSEFYYLSGGYTTWGRKLGIGTVDVNGRWFTEAELDEVRNADNAHRGRQSRA